MNSGYAKEHSSILGWTLRTVDWLIILLSGYLSFIVIDLYKTLPTYDMFLPQPYTTALVISFLLSIWVFPSFYAYRTWRGESLLTECRTLLLAWGSVFLGIIAISVITKTSADYSRTWLAAWFLIGLVGLVFSRMALRLLLRSLRKRGINQRHMVIVGSGELGQQVARKVLDASWTGLNISGFFTDTPTKRLPPEISEIKDLGELKDVAAYVDKNNVDQVWITLSFRHLRLLEKLLEDLATTSTDVRLIPDIFSLRLLNHSISQVDGLPVINLSVSPMVGINRVVKWVEDKLLSLLIVMLISPLMALIALGVKLSSPGPIFYRQERVSWNGRPFEMLKFRSMPIDTDARTGGPVWGGAQGKKPTKFGAFIRRTSLDELPQFLNVLKGDMSIVGPRPERTVFVDQFKHEVPNYMKKHLVKAGITGWAQINGWRGDTCLHSRVEHDLFYIENWSIWLDAKIILLTFFKGLINKNAY